MLVLGIESSCDETGLALYDTLAPTPKAGLLAHALHSQITMHQAYGGVVPELASRDHIRRLIPLLEQVLQQAEKNKQDIDAIAYTAGPGLAGALLVGASFANALGFAINKPCYPVHHLEGHLLSPLLADHAPEYPFIALLVSGGHTQLIHVAGVGQYILLGETLDDAAGEAFDKTAKLLGLPYPGGPAISALAEEGRPNQYQLPRPMLHSGNFEFSFAGLKTAVLTQVKKWPAEVSHEMKADLARSFVDAITDVLCAKATQAVLKSGLKQLVVAGGVGANRQLRAALNAAGAIHGFRVLYPELEFCTDNGAMIAFAGGLRLEAGLATKTPDYQFGVTPRWDLQEYLSS